MSQSLEPPAYVIIVPNQRRLPIVHGIETGIVKRCAAVASEMQYFEYNSQEAALEEAERLTYVFPGIIFLVAEVFATVSSNERYSDGDEL